MYSLSSYLSFITKTSTGYEGNGRLAMYDVTRNFIITFLFTKDGNGVLIASNFDIYWIDLNRKAPEPDLPLMLH